MNKIKIIIVCLLVVFFALITLTFWKIKSNEEIHQKAVLAQEIQKALYHIMFDLRSARENTIMDLPADGMWYNHIAFNRVHQGVLEYKITGGHLLRVINGKGLLIADHIGDMRIRRQKTTPYILEVQIEAQNNVSLKSYLKIRIRQ